MRRVLATVRNSNGFVLGGIGTALIFAGLLTALVAAAASAPVPAVLGLVVSWLGEAIGSRWGGAFRNLLRISSLGLTARLILRTSVVVVLAATGAVPHPWVVAGLTALLVVARVLDVLTVYRLRRRRAAPIRARNLDPALPSAPEIPKVVTGNDFPRIAVAEVLVLAPGLLWTNVAVVVTLGALGLVWTLSWVVVSTLFARRIGSSLTVPELLPRVQAFLDAYRPTVVLYFSGDTASAYQVNVWLSTLERLDLPVLILVREHGVFNALAPTRLPVLSIPGANEVMALDLSSLKVAYFASNVGKNLHMLRVPSVFSTFIGHGDSDKNASFNPFTRVYDEVWVAGQAGRDRYVRAQVGVRDEQVVEVGRPQLDDVVRGPLAARETRTVLYAPTWEGWNEEQAYSSVVGVGERLVDAVLSSPRPVRLVYKPHPFTGRRSAAVRAAHERIVARIVAGGGVVIGAGSPEEREAEDDAEVAVAGAERVVETGAVGLEHQQLVADAARLAAAGESTHLVVMPSGPALYACFNEADALVTDISSVLSDFVVSGRPYAVGNPWGTSAAEFVEEFPSSRAGTLLGADGSGIEEFLDVVTGARPDEQAADRVALGVYLLGASEQAAIDRFRDATLALGARADARARALAGAEDVPSADDEAPTSAPLVVEGADGMPAPTGEVTTVDPAAGPSGA